MENSNKGQRFESVLLHKSVQDYKTVPIYSIALELHVKKKEYGGTVDALVLGTIFFGFESQYSHKHTLIENIAEGVSIGRHFKLQQKKSHSPR